MTDPGLAPEGKAIAYILVPVPNLERSTLTREFLDETVRSIVLEQIRVQTGVDLADLIEVEHRFYPEDFLTRYQVQHGATFGLAHTLMQSAFFRPANQDPREKNIFYVGASTQPGGGLPPVLAGSRIVADLISGRPG